MDPKMTPMEKIEAMSNVLEKIGDLPGGGRAKCGLVWVMGDLLEKLGNDILVMQERLSGMNGQDKEQEAGLEVIDDEEDVDKENG